MGFVVRESDATEAPEVQELEDPDWYILYCQAVAAGIDPREFGDYTYSQILAMIDGHKLSRYNDRHFSVMDIVSNMDDDGVRKSLYEGGGGNPLRGKLVEKMMRPYMPEGGGPLAAEQAVLHVARGGPSQERQAHRGLVPEGGRGNHAGYREEARPSRYVANHSSNLARDSRHCSSVPSFSKVKIGSPSLT